MFQNISSIFENIAKKIRLQIVESDGLRSRVQSHFLPSPYQLGLGEGEMVPVRVRIVEAGTR